MWTRSAFFSLIVFFAIVVADAVLRHHQRVNDYYLVRTGVEGALFADFDNDGNPDHLFVGRDQRLRVVSHVGRQLIELPFNNTDNSLRTHVAVSSVTHESSYPSLESRTFRLIVLQPTDSDLRVEIYAYQDGALALTPTIPSDRPIVDALRTEDERGTYLMWGLYSILRLPILLVAGGLLFLANRSTAGRYAP